MADQNIDTHASAEEAETTPASNVQDDSAGNEQQTQETQTQRQEEPDKFTRQHKVYLKQQEDIRKRKQELDSREQELQSKYGRWQSWDEELEKGNPWQFLKDKGYDLLTLEKMALSDGQDPRAVAQAIVEEETKKLKADYEAKFQELQNQRQQEQDEQFQAKLTHNYQTTLQEIDSFLDANVEQFELTRAYPGSNDAILKVIWGEYQRTEGQTVLTYEQAAGEVERFLEDEELRNNPLIKTGKAKNLLFGEKSDVVKRERTSNDHVKDRSKPRQRATSNQEPRTISQKMSSVSTPASGRETPQERRERLFEELRNGTWKPKAEYMQR